eukprot:CAMPEP_0171970060 /NCGR_PEP_ID=MMETSP0993-20121228/211331_1 /TAXON_ID=483369 /ORGANISM="non described non described, Strain CCMP2098" /LENGTH=93 /DNA_ID=CAMNT_0012620101 /DNA_START=257 /DNA_END=539 /DNA_ORIENTATION=+
MRTTADVVPRGWCVLSAAPARNSLPPAAILTQERPMVAKPHLGLRGSCRAYYYVTIDIKVEHEGDVANFKVSFDEYGNSLVDVCTGLICHPFE